MKSFFILEDNRVYAIFLETQIKKIFGDVSIQIERRMDEARQILSDKTFDFIISDLGLLDSFGIDTVKEVLQLAPYTPILVLTANEDQSLGTEAVKIGVQDFLVKGEFTPEALEKKIKYADERQRFSNERHKLENQFFQEQQLMEAGQLAAGIANEIQPPVQPVSDSLTCLNDLLSKLKELFDTYDEILAKTNELDLSPELMTKAEKTGKGVELEKLKQEIFSALKEVSGGAQKLAETVLSVEELSHSEDKGKDAAGSTPLPEVH